LKTEHLHDHSYRVDSPCKLIIPYHNSHIFSHPAMLGYYMTFRRKGLSWVTKTFVWKILTIVYQHIRHGWNQRRQWTRWL